MRAGIPTTYSQVNFRSRLEARWAKFFDLCGWRWEYEPIDLEGYIPDFILLFKNPILVEVKPEFTREGLLRHQDKIIATSWDGEALLLGATVFQDSNISQPAIGLLADWDNWGNGRIGVVWDKDNIEHAGQRSNDPNFQMAAMFHCNVCRKLSFCHEDNYYACCVNGCHDGDHHIGPIDYNGVLDIWKRAGNAVQWGRQ
jgi:hypothetical protein